ncbi:unnamed protein product [Schistosoma curassoni]|uniref:Secreted protein n=1 Tax=Schistosoma curassoni TaxID=6186 RepID=A0A183K4D5_9TREM|nr:unnamed protein product [Schistosoma curassoni]
MLLYIPQACLFLRLTLWVNGDFACKSNYETLDPGFVLLGTRQQGVPVILSELVLPGGLDPVSPSFTVRDVTTELSGLGSTSSLKITGIPC